MRAQQGDPRLARIALDDARGLLAGLEDAAKLSTPLRWSLAGEYDALGDSAKAAQVLGWGAQDDASHAQRAMLLDKAKDKTGLAALYDELKREATHPNPMRRLLLGQLAELLERFEDARDWYANVPGEGAQGIARLRGASVLHAMGRQQAAYDELRAIQSDATLDEEARRARGRFVPLRASLPLERLCRERLAPEGLLEPAR